MAIATNTSLTYSSVELKKQIADIIYNIAPLNLAAMSGNRHLKIV